MIARLKQWDWTQWLILLVTCSLFLPYEIHTGVLLGSFILTLVKKDCFSSLRRLPGKWFILPLLILEALVSLLYKNYTGALISINFIGLFFYLAFYHKHLNKELFMVIVDVVIALMIGIGIYALFQFNTVSKMGGYAFTDFVIQNSPKRRITGVFQNANIFAMMLELVLTMILYRFLQTKRWILKGYYFIAAIFLFIIMALTGCRAALIPLVFVIPILLAYAKEKKLFIIYALVLVGVIGLVVMKPTIIPRIDDISTIQSRVKIWKTAIKGIRLNPWLGNGPWTYQHIYPLFDGHKAPHAHNIYLDSVLSFGIVGTTLLVLFVISIFKTMFKEKDNQLLFGMMVSFMVILALHGLVDGTIHPEKVMLLAFMIFYNQTDLKTRIQSDTL